MLSRTDIEHALQALADQLEEVGARYEIAVVGGAAVVLLYGARNSTKDVDALFLAGGEPSILRRAVERTARALELPDDWMNDAAKGFVHGLSLGRVVIDRPGLVVTVLAPHQLLAMKLCAWRDDVDIEDARLLLSKLSGSQDEIWRLI